ncbi:MAG TPA: hypothetical protein VIV11_15455 [Kofleriaceae bacterium]
MSRATWVFAATSVVGVALAIYLYLDNRALEDALAEARANKPAPAPAEKVAAAGNADPWTDIMRASGAARGTGTGPAPSLPEEQKESRLERRQRRQQELAAWLGRLDGETEEEYRNRIMPMITAGLLVPRSRVDEMRKQAEEKAGVTPEQSKKLDQAFEKVYADAIDYTNKAIADGMLTPYERNVSGMLEFAGGLGGLLTEANGQIGQILSAQQMRAMSQSGFEWGEYLGLNAPWEQLRPPPPR